MKRLALVAVVAWVGVFAACALGSDGGGGEGALSWVRVTESEDRELRLEVAVRRYEAAGLPSLTLASAVHVADRSYYQRLQSMLDEKDLVLFEGVKPAGLREDVPASASGKRRLTEDRVRLVMLLFRRAERAVDEGGDDGVGPAGAGGLGELGEFFEERGDHESVGWLAIAGVDAWGNPVRIEGEGGVVDVVSLGADGEPGGTGAAADIRYSDLEPLSAAELGEVEGIQAQLARALRLRFQLEEMDETGENWRNADLSMGEIRERIRAAGGDPEPLFGQLQGTGLSGRVVGLLLRFIEILPGAQPRAKMMMIEMLGEAEGLLETGAGPIGEEMLSVIIDERDDVAVGALAEVLDGEAVREGWEELAIIYGAGHMPGIHDRVTAQFGYEPVGAEWLAAMGVDLDRSGISPMEHRMLRMQLRRQLAAMREAAGE